MLEAEINAGKTVVPRSGGKPLLRPGHPQQFRTSSNAPAHPTASSVDDWNVAGFPGAELLSEMISKAKLISECLMVSDGVDLKLEEAFCLFLLGQGTEADALERLREAESKKNSGTRNSILGRQGKDAAAANCSLVSPLSVFLTLQM